LRVIPGLVCRSCLGFGRHLGYRRFSFSGWLAWTRLFEKEYLEGRQSTAATSWTKA
jgi:hypothetical protein